MREALTRPIRDPAALAYLASALSHQQHPCVRRAAARMLGESRAPDTRRLLSTALRDKSPRVREAAALALSQAENPATLRDLTGALKRAPRRLVAALGDRDTELAIIAAHALGKIGDTTVVPALAARIGVTTPGSATRW